MLLPATVAAHPESAGLAAGVGCAVGRAVGDGKDVRRGKLGVAPRVPAVLGLEDSAAAAAGENALSVARVDSHTLRAGLLEDGLGAPAGNPCN